MSDTITITGFVGTEPRHTQTAEGLAVTNFRLASTQRKYDRSQAKWVDGDTNWFTVSAFRQLAVNAAGSLHKGDRVFVSGRLKVRDWAAGDRAGTSVDIEADSMGHDLLWGTTMYTRSIVSSLAPTTPSAEVFPAEVAGADSLTGEVSSTGAISPAGEVEETIALSEDAGEGDPDATANPVPSVDRSSVPF
jgi:single-strand DNA-binding protein